MGTNESVGLFKVSPILKLDLVGADLIPKYAIDVTCTPFYLQNFRFTQA